MAWPQKVLRQFQLVPPNSDEGAYCGPWNKLLYTLFPADSDFTVVPNFQELGSTQGADFLISIDVYIGNKPVLLVELKKPNNLRYISRREDADMQLRRRLRDLVRDCPIPTMYGISAFGSRVCFYRLSTVPGSPINPPLIPRDLEYVNDVAPEDRWNDNVLDVGGEDKLRQVVREIFDACSNL
ncbi:hypothetical protein M407DRAFT_26367 [Tulasnella calospora MUT 4182]|uniref:Fungal-type protein kinase domain-containing protein n=1 Tax=Tulasnella calospora MUT 4182 TaxID=1051891 RepID=A0A0C3KS25_9AGAM|nr:hypothetical protein M407DRAFT_26367 [Tulasnella calospora MUT 4182]